MRPRRLIQLCLLSSLAAAGMATATARAASAADTEVEEGRRLFMSNGCYACHGTVGQGGERSGGPRLAPSPYPVEALRAILRNPPEAMPRFDPKYLSDSQVLAIHRYLASIPKGPAAQDLPLLRTAPGT